MNEEMEYAEMLEIPVSTVNVVQKKSKRKEKKGLQESLIFKINEKIEQDKRDFSLVENPAPELAIDMAQDDAPQEQRGGAVTVLLEQNNAPVPKKDKMRAVGDKILKAEFVLTCALCGGIFLTNVFMPRSAINTFFRSLGNAEQKTVERRYDEFVLSSVVGENSNAEITLSPTGVLTFTGAGFVYPVASGKVSAVEKTAGDTFEITVEYTSEFCGVFSGLSSAYYAVGDSVKENIPLGYSDGKTGVSVALYSDGELLNCFTLDSENRPTWNENKN